MKYLHGLTSKKHWQSAKLSSCHVKKPVLSVSNLSKNSPQTLTVHLPALFPRVLLQYANDKDKNGSFPYHCKGVGTFSGDPGPGRVPKKLLQDRVIMREGGYKAVPSGTQTMHQHASCLKAVRARTELKEVMTALGSSLTSKVGTSVGQQDSMSA